MRNPWLPVQQDDLEFRSKVNEVYRTAVSAVLVLGTAALNIPLFIVLKAGDIAGHASQFPLAKCLSGFLLGKAWTAWLSWLFLAVSICAALHYYYLSAKWLRVLRCADRRVSLYFGPLRCERDDAQVEKCMDLSFGVTMFLFVLGIVSGVSFMLTFEPLLLCDP